MGKVLTIEREVQEAVSSIMCALGMMDGTWAGDSARDVMEVKIQELVNKKCTQKTS